MQTYRRNSLLAQPRLATIEAESEARSEAMHHGLNMQSDPPNLIPMVNP